MVASVRLKLVNMFMSDAMRPANYSKSVVVEMDNDGSVAFAACMGESLPPRNGKIKYIFILTLIFF